MLLTKHKNELLEIINSLNISPHYIIKKDSQANLFELKLKDGPFFFRVTPNTSSLGGEFVVNSLPKHGAFSAWDGQSWIGVLNDFKWWAEEIKEEIDTPDLWAKAAKTAQLFTGTLEAPNDKFTRTELAEVQGQLRQLQQSFAAALPEAARQKLIELTQTAAVKAESLTKKDWQNWIIGGFISSITALALNPTQAGEVLKLVKAAFGGLFLH